MNVFKFMNQSIDIAWESVFAFVEIVHM